MKHVFNTDNNHGSEKMYFLDIDECRTPANNCRYACKNLVGSFMCVCPEGFEQIGPGDVCKGMLHDVLILYTFRECYQVKNCTKFDRF
jgi:hypothetical protein